MREREREREREGGREGGREREREEREREREFIRQRVCIRTVSITGGSRVSSTETIFFLVLLESYYRRATKSFLRK
jgi:hypothetical protein